MRMAEKIFPPKNLVYGFWRENFFPSFSFPPNSLLAAAAPTSLAAAAAGRSCSSSYQMSLLLRIVEPGRLKPWVFGPSFYPLDLVNGIVLILELSDEL
jgi:hypothetical protein